MIYFHGPVFNRTLTWSCCLCHKKSEEQTHDCSSQNSCQCLWRHLGGFGVTFDLFNMLAGILQLSFCQKARVVTYRLSELWQIKKTKLLFFFFLFFQLVSSIFGRDRHHITDDVALFLTIKTTEEQTYSC